MRGGWPRGGRERGKGGIGGGGGWAEGTAACGRWNGGNTPVVVPDCVLSLPLVPGAVAHRPAPAGNGYTPWARAGGPRAAAHTATTVRPLPTPSPMLPPSQARTVPVDYPPVRSTTAFRQARARGGRATLPIHLPPPPQRQQPPEGPPPRRRDSRQGCCRRPPPPPAHPYPPRRRASAAEPLLHAHLQSLPRPLPTPVTPPGRARRQRHGRRRVPPRGQPAGRGVRRPKRAGDGGGHGGRVARCAWRPPCGRGWGVERQPAARDCGDGPCHRGGGTAPPIPHSPTACHGVDEGGGGAGGRTPSCMLTEAPLRRSRLAKRASPGHHRRRNGHPVGPSLHGTSPRHRQTARPQHGPLTHRTKRSTQRLPSSPPTLPYTTAAPPHPPVSPPPPPPPSWVPTPPAPAPNPPASPPPGRRPPAGSSPPPAAPAAALPGRRPTAQPRRPKSPPPPVPGSTP